MPKVLITPMTLAGVQAGFLDVLRSGGFEPVYPLRIGLLTEQELLQQLPGIWAVLAGSEPYTSKVLDASPELRVIARVGVGYDAVDVPHATRRGVAVTITPGANHDGVAEQTFALMLAVAKDVIPQHLGTRHLTWPRRTTLAIRGKTLGIAGLGRIGKAVALRAKAFGMKLKAYDPVPDHEFARANGVELVALEKLLAEADFLSLHLPYTPESKHLINKKTLALMKPGAILLNTARGGLVCEADLIEALQAKKLAGAGLDVFEQEPPSDSPLFRMDNVVVSPHLSGADFQSRDDMAYSGATAIVKLHRGEWPAEQVVNPDVKERFRP